MFSKPKTTKTQFFLKEINVFQAPETQKMQKSQKTQLSHTFWGWGWQLARSFKKLSFLRFLRFLSFCHKLEKVEFFEIFEIFEFGLELAGDMDGRCYCGTNLFSFDVFVTSFRI